VPEVPFEDGPYGVNGQFYNMGRHIPPTYASGEHGVMPEINWSAMPAPHHTMTNISYMQHDPVQNGHIMGRASAPGTPSYYNEAVLARRHEIILTQPTNPVHDKIRKMWIDGVVTHDEFSQLFDESPGNSGARHALLMQLMQAHKINKREFEDLCHGA